MIRVFLEYRGVTGIRRGSQWALMGLSGKERQQPGGGARPSQAQSEVDKGFGGTAPLSLPPPPLLSPLLRVGLGKEETYSYSE